MTEPISTSIVLKKEQRERSESNLSVANKAKNSDVKYAFKKIPRAVEIREHL